MSLRADQAGQEPLFGPRKAGHVGILRNVGAVALVAVVRDIEADLVQARTPVEHVRGQFGGQ